MTKREENALRQLIETGEPVMVEKLKGVGYATVGKLRVDGLVEWVMAVKLTPKGKAEAAKLHAEEG